MSANWSVAMVDYFNKDLKSDITQYAAKWLLKDAGVFNPYSGITKNTAESMNAVMKRLLEWKEVPADTIVLSLHYLQQYYWSEILRGFCGLGNYELDAKFSNILADPADVTFPKTIIDPNDIVDKVRADIHKILAPPAPPPTAPDTTDEVADVITPTDPPPIDRVLLTQAAMAQAVIDEQRIQQVPGMSSFVIKGNRDDNYAVTLFPKEHCQCPATTTCHHILAARKSVGMPIEEKKRTLSLSRLARNNRKKADKKSGRKRPRPLDVDVTPAPDSKRSAPSTSPSPTSLKTPRSTKKKPSAKKLRFDDDVFLLPPTPVTAIIGLDLDERVPDYSTQEHSDQDDQEPDVQAPPSPPTPPTPPTPLRDGCLTDKEMYRASQLLQIQFPGVDGLQDTVLQQNNSFNLPTREFVQFFHVDGNHWITASNIGTTPTTSMSTTP